MLPVMVVSMSDQMMAVPPCPLLDETSMWVLSLMKVRWLLLISARSPNRVT
jgi:hypothetical protein